MIAAPLKKEIYSRLNFLNEVGLNYLSLSRKSSTLSGGESQRIRLASQIGSGLTGVTYVLDEPSIGLHQRDNQKLINTLKNLRDLGNSIIVVEHDEDIIKEADYVVDIGRYAGINGGSIVAEGDFDMILRSSKKLQEQWIVKEIDCRDRQTRSVTRMQITSSALGLDFDSSAFLPSGLSQSVQIDPKLFNSTD